MSGIDQDEPPESARSRILARLCSGASGSTGSTSSAGVSGSTGASDTVGAVGSPGSAGSAGVSDTVVASGSTSSAGAWGHLSPADCWSAFVTRAKQAACEVITAAHEQEFAEGVATWCHEHQLPLQFRVADGLLDEACGRVLVQHYEGQGGRVDGNDCIGVTAAIAGIAETGSLVLHDRPGFSVPLHFVVPNVVIVVRCSAVVATMEHALAGLTVRESEGAGDGLCSGMINFVTGTSRTGDIDLSVQLGIHGPRRVLVVGVSDALYGEGEAVDAGTGVAPR